MIGSGKRTGTGRYPPEPCDVVYAGTPVPDTEREGALLAAVDRYVSQRPPGDGQAAKSPADILRLHVPGHKGGPGAPPRLVQRWGEALFKDDLTEVPGLDDLAAPAGPIAEMQCRIATQFGAGHAFCLVQGTTSGLVALLLAVARTAAAGTGRGPRYVLLPRFSHRALVAAVILSGLAPVFCRTRWAGDLPGGPDLEHLAELLATKRGRIAAVVDTYPSMFGVAHDLSAVAALCRDASIPLLVDGAHASLCGLVDGLPAAPLAAGAAAVVLSTHKDLGSLTQSSVLLLSERDQAPRALDVAAALRLVNTTSPSYPLMLSVEAAVAHAFSESGRAQLSRAVAAAARAPALLAAVGIGTLVGNGPGVVQDPLRLNLDAWAIGMTGMELAASLRETASVQVEASDWRSVLMVLTAADGDAVIERLIGAMQEVRHARSSGSDAGGGFAAAQRLHAAQADLFAPPTGKPMSPREAFFGPFAHVPLAQAAGRVAAEAVSPYPPGVPLVWPGEEITTQAVTAAAAVLAAGGELHGVVRDAADGAVRLAVVALEE